MSLVYKIVMFSKFYRAPSEQLIFDLLPGAGADAVSVTARFRCLTVQRRPRASMTFNRILWLTVN